MAGRRNIVWPAPSQWVIIKSYFRSVPSHNGINNEAAICLYRRKWSFMYKTSQSICLSARHFDTLLMRCVYAEVSLELCWEITRPLRFIGRPFLSISNQAAASLPRRVRYHGNPCRATPRDFDKAGSVRTLLPGLNGRQPPP